MAPRCQFCSRYSINHLVALAERNTKAAYYSHLESFAYLEQSAQDGCDLCRLILDCFKAAEHDEIWPRNFERPGRM
jgi:hypothetical protein